MTATLLDGTQIASQVQSEVARDVEEMKAQGITLSEIGDGGVEDLCAALQ